MLPYLPDASRLDWISIALFFVSVTCLTVGLLWLLGLAFVALIRGWKRTRWPLGLFLLGLLLGAGTLTWSALLREEVIDLGPRERLVDGERHITLTGWDHPAADYRRLQIPSDTVVLQAANPDITDEEVVKLQDLAKLRELDLNDSRITDQSLEILARLPALQRLRLRNTGITNAGFVRHLASKESLEQLDVRGTAILPETLRAWRETRPSRRAVGP